MAKVHSELFEKRKRFRGAAGGSQRASQRFRKGRMAAPRRQRLGGTSPLSVEVERDPAGRIVGKVESTGGRKTTWEYAHDKDGRLLNVLRDGMQAERYTYDGGGRRILDHMGASIGEDRRLVYDKADRLLQAGGVRYEYDEVGRLSARTDANGTTRFAHGHTGFLDCVVLPGGGELTYERGEDALLRRKLLNGRPLEEFTWLDPLRLESWMDMAGNRRMEFQYTGASCTPNAITVTENGYRYTCTLGADQVGTVKAVADSSGMVIKVIQYDSFGNLLSDTNPSFRLPVGFAGGIVDRHVKLIRFGYRYYLPEVGRFTAPDPARWTGGDPDFYDYCVDAPINKVDPLGLSPEPSGGEKRPGTSGKPIPHDELYWVFRPKEEACKKCQAMKEVYFKKRPEYQVHPNCKCLLESVKAADLPHDRNRIIIPPGVNLEENIAEARRLGKKIWKVPFPPNQQEMYKHLAKVSKIAIYFIESFRSGGKYDYKRRDPQYEPFGNYHYGLYCRAIGLNDELARYLAGKYQELSGTSDPKFASTWGDDPNDYNNIKRGQESLDE